MRVCIEADGGSRGNPGIAGAGTVVYDASRNEVLRRISYVVGIATNNVAEYQGLINGLSAAGELGATEVEVFLDSKLVVEQMSGRWKIKHPDMKKLALKARDLAAQFDSVTYNWVARAKNEKADELANQAMDAAARGAKPGLLAGPGDTQGSGVGGGEPAAGSRAQAPVSDTNNPARWSGASSTPTRLILLRHGQTPMSAARQYSGQSDPELSELGQQQAQAAAAALQNRGGIDAVVSSPLRRARATAEEAASRLGLDLRIHAGLTEMDFGNWDGLTFDEARSSHPELHERWLRDSSVAAPGGESLQKTHRRVKKVREELQTDYPGQNVLLVSHLTVIKSLLRQGLDAGPQLFQRLFLDLASISIVEFYPEGLTSVRLVNDTSHLR